MDSDMKVNAKVKTKATLYLASCSLMTACGSLVSLDDDIPAPPVPREARQLRIPADLASNKPERSSQMLIWARPPGAYSNPVAKAVIGTTHSIPLITRWAAIRLSMCNC